jgi:periplasmic protein CpxP/Spy
MNTIRKSIFVAVATLGLGTGAFAAADSSAVSTGGGSHSALVSHETRSAEHLAKRQTALHDKLGLSSTQETAWKTFTEKLQAATPIRQEAAPAKTMTAPERADRMAASLQTAQQQAVKRAQAVKELYAVLTPDQQKIFDGQFQGRHHHFGRG